MKLSDFDYNLPKEMIATEPASPRDAARLFVYDRLNTPLHPSFAQCYGTARQGSAGQEKSVHVTFNKIGDFLNKGDALVLNDTKVIPARLVGRLMHGDGSAGRKFKILLLEKKTPDTWACLIDGHGRKEGLNIFFDKNSQSVITKRLGGGIWEIKFNKSGKALEKLINKIGEMPLPPYIKQKNEKTEKRKNKEWYQTVYAKYVGSVAAPTAGLHFTPRLLAQLKRRGIKIEYVTLHVGMGTFLPVRSGNIEEHKMHEELAIITPKTAKALNAAKKEGRRIVACGTTTARTLEAFAASGRLCAGKKHTDIFIYPPYRPKFVDALITNFHLPKSTLMMLAAAFLSPGKAGGIKKINELYQEAIDNDYRFYSYGDAMLIL